MRQLWLLLLAAPALVWAKDAEAPASTDQDLARRCIEATQPQSRTDFPNLLNCMGLLQEAVEVGVQAGVHAKDFLEQWRGKRLRLIDLWGQQVHAPDRHDMFYVDIANFHGVAARQQHLLQCKQRVKDYLEAGRAEIHQMDSLLAASRTADADLDFVYLDARHDFAGVVADIHAWWPKVRVGGIFAGHDFVDGEFPEGDFFWLSALEEVLPGLSKHVHVTSERNKYPSFFVVKTKELAQMALREVSVEVLRRRLYLDRSRYFQLWKAAMGSGAAGDIGNVSEVASQFIPACQSLCGGDCATRVQGFTPTRSAGSTLRPFACGNLPAGRDGSGAEADFCGSELVVDVQAYQAVCLDRCNVTCEQRQELFTEFGAEILAA